MDNFTFWISFGPLFAINGYVITMLIVYSLIHHKIAKVGFIEERHHSKILNKWIRQFWVWLTMPMFRFILWLKLTPNQISALGTVFGGLSGLALAFSGRWLGVGSYGLGGWLMIIGCCLDFMDGRVARETGQETLAGAFFDSVMDRVSESAVFCGLIWYFRESWHLWLVMGAFTGAMLTSYSKCRGDKMGANYGGGMMQRPERMVYIGVGAVLVPLFGLGFSWLLPNVFADLKSATDAVYAVPLAFVAVLANYTTFDRIVNIMRLLDEREGRR